MYTTIELTLDQQRAAIREGQRRQGTNERNNTRGRNRAPERGKEAMNYHLCGALGEMAVASYLDLEEHLYQDLTPVRGSCDLPLIDVKSRSNHRYELLCQTDDHDEKILVLVTVQNSEIRLHGWMESYWAKTYPIVSFRSGRPAHVVPQADLQDPSLLRVDTLF